MQKLIVLAAAAGLAACSKTAPPPAPADTTSAQPSETVAEPVALDGKPSVGTYRVTGPDGKIFTQQVHADGTYSNSIDGKPDGSGVWEQKSPQVFCTTKNAPGAKQSCNDESYDDKGVWKSVDRETGETFTVERIEGDAVATPAAE